MPIFSDSWNQVIPLLNDGIAPRLIGMDAMQIERCWQGCWPALDFHFARGLGNSILPQFTRALAAVDNALWDAVGKALETPCYQMWGAYTNELPVVSFDQRYRHPGVNYDPVDGNRRLLESINGIERFVPQFTCNPATFNIETFAKSVSDNNIKSLRMEPISQNYPFVEWIVGECMEWITESKLTLFIPATDINPNEFHSVLKSFPKSKVVLSDLHYTHVPWAIPLLKSNLQPLSLV